MSTETKKHIIAVSGSLKRSSYNHQLLKNAAAQIPAESADVSVIHLADCPLPLFNEEIEQQTIPHLDELRSLFGKADALLIASPEYNGSFTGALKNLLDWLSRPAKDGHYQPAFSQQTAAIMSASPGGLGGLRGLRHLHEVLNNLGTLVLPTQIALPSAMNAFDEKGQLINSATQDRLAQQSAQLLKQLGV